jgi:hypothetical protein
MLAAVYRMALVIALEEFLPAFGYSAVSWR